VERPRTSRRRGGRVIGGQTEVSKEHVRAKRHVEWAPLIKGEEGHPKDGGSEEE